MCRLYLRYTAWKVSIFWVFLVLIFRHLNWISPYLFVCSPNAGKYGPGKLKIRTLFTQWLIRSHNDEAAPFSKTWEENSNRNWFGLFHFHNYLKLTKMGRFLLLWIEIQNSKDRLTYIQCWERNKFLFQPMCVRTSIKIYTPLPCTHVLWNPLTLYTMYVFLRDDSKTNFTAKMENWTLSLLCHHFSLFSLTPSHSC